MTSSGLELLLRLRTPESFVGVLACAAPRGRSVVGRDDISLLSAAAGSLALALSQTFAFETIRRINAELEERVERRTKELERTRVQLYQREKMSALGLLAAGVAHELNTPIGVVMSASDQLAAALGIGDRPLPKAEKLAILCRTAAGRAADIVRSLGDFSKPDRAVTEDVDVGSLITTTVRVLEATLAAREVEVRQTVEPVPPLHCNPALIHQALSYLILNAAQAMPGGGVVTVRARAGTAGRVYLVVEDTGPGVPDAIRARIFEPFFTTKPPGEGVGLGLSLCFNIAELHDGTIREEGDAHGARFVLDLPLERRAG
jgi:two-component system NtrC family sensor kinase